MKKYFILAASAIAFASCTNDEFVGEPSPSTEPVANNEAILFRSSTSALTRAEGSDAAELLDNNFVVEGVKTVTTGAVEVFDHYNVNWSDGTANTTASNTKNWEYVAQDQNIKGTSAKLSDASAQTIKYWDYAATQYDFVAVSLGKGVTFGDPATTSYAKLSKISYAKIGGGIKADGTDAVYTLTGTTDQLAASYVADLITLYNQSSVSDYGTTVTPKFRCLGAKVRLAFYETVPGYSVGDVEFYAQKWTSAKPGTTTDGSSSATPTIFSETAVFAPSTGDGVMSIYYPTVGFTKRPGVSGADPDYNQAHVVFKAGSDMTMAKTKTFGTLNYTDPTTSAKNTGNALGTTSATATYAGTTNNGYNTVLPLGSSDNLQIRIKYTLYPDDGGSETIVVDNACAVVPKEYAAWNPNYAYTYIFKISDNTNGATGVDGSGNIVEGLTPITFDAVVIDTEDGIQETITTVSTPSITTYQMGKVVTAGSEYKAGDVYVSVENNPALSSANAHLYLAEVKSGAPTDTQISEATAAWAIEQGKSDNTSNTYDKTNVTLEQVFPAVEDYVTSVPAVDGNTYSINALRFTAATGKNYVFEYVNAGKKTYKVIKVQ